MSITVIPGRREVGQARLSMRPGMAKGEESIIPSPANSDLSEFGIWSCLPVTAALPGAGIAAKKKAPRMRGASEEGVIDAFDSNGPAEAVRLLLKAEVCIARVKCERGRVSQQREILCFQRSAHLSAVENKESRRPISQSDPALSVQIGLFQKLRPFARFDRDVECVALAMDRERHIHPRRAE